MGRRPVELLHPGKRAPIDRTESGMGMGPKSEPEVIRANGRAAVASYNEDTHKPYRGGFPLALEFAERAYEAHSLPYKAGLSSIIHYPPDRFTWLYDEAGDAKDCVKVRDNKTGRVVVWRHWFGL